MSHYHVDERDMMFNLRECPGIGALTGIPAFSELGEDMLEMVYEQSKSFCLKVLSPLLMSSDREGCQLENGHVRLPKGMAEAWNQYRELGMIGMTSSSEYGGADLPHFFSAPTTELECGSFVSFSMLPLLTRGAARLVLSFGSQALKKSYVEKMFNGEWSGTMCLTESDAGSDVGSGTTKAIPEDDHYRICGSKIFISWGEHDLTDNIIHLVLARIVGEPEGSKGLSLFVVPKFRIDENGKLVGPNDVTCGNIEHKLGINASPTCLMNFGTNDQCIGYLVGEPNQGMRYMFQMMNEARLEVGIQGMAQASAAYLSALEYAKQRTQGTVSGANGRHSAKIIEHPDVKRMLLQMRATSHGCRAMLYQMALYLDLSHHSDDMATRQKYSALTNLLTPVCKSYCSDEGFRVTEMAIQTYGGYGYIQEYPVEQYMRDLKISSIYEGTNGIQAMDLVFRKILRDQGEALKLFISEILALCKSLADSPLAPLGDILSKSVAVLGATALRFGQQFMEGAVETVQFRATAFQYQMGHIVCGYFLLNQAQVAATAVHAEIKTSDRSFYEQKIVTATFFIRNQLPSTMKALQALQSDDCVESRLAFP